MKKVYKNTKGITLIALVITIVVILILAAISLSLVLGENGIINRSKEARDKSAQGELEESLQLYLASETLNSENQKNYDDFAAEIKSEFGDETIVDTLTDENTNEIDYAIRTKDGKTHYLNGSTKVIDAFVEEENTTSSYDVKVVGYRLSLNENFALRFYFTMPASKLTSGTEKIVFKNTFDNTTIEVNVNANNVFKEIVNGQEYYYIPYNFSLKSISDGIEFCAYNGASQDSNKYTMSAKQVGNAILAEEDKYPESLINLVRSYLFTGGKIQLYFGYNTSNLASDGIDIDLSYVTSELLSEYASQNSNTTIYAGASLIFSSNPKVRQYYSGTSSDNYSFYIDGKDASDTYQLISSYHSVLVYTGCLGMDKTHTFVVKDENGNIVDGPLKYSGYSYVYGVISNPDYNEVHKNMVRSLYHFTETAKAHFGTY